MTTSVITREVRVLVLPDGWENPFPLFGGPAAETICDGVRIVSAGLAYDSRTLRGIVRGGWELRRKIAQFRPDLVHVHFASVRALTAVVVSSAPVVISFKGSDLLGHYNRRGRPALGGRMSVFLSRVSAYGAARCIAKTEELRSRLWSKACRDRCVVIPNGVNLERFRPIPRDEARRQLGWEETEPVVLFMNRQGAWVKDPDLARAAIRVAQRTLPAVRLQVVEREPIARMPLFYSAADVLLLTSRHEGSNNTTKEAMACDLPVVATACGDVRERLAGVKNSHVCSRDPEELGARLVEVLRSGERSDGRRRILPLSEAWMLTRVLSVYTTVLDGIGSGESGTMTGRRQSAP